MKDKDKKKRGFVERLAERLGMAASSKIVYSDPVEQDGVKVIPVAKVSWGFGGGAGRKNGQKGEGGGGGVHARPVGFIEIKDGQSHYRPIVDPVAMIPVVVVGGLTGLLLLRSLRKLLRG